MTRVFLPHVITDDSALGGSEIERSLRFRGSSSAKLTRTFGTNTSNTIKTASCWVKRGKTGTYQNIFSTTLSGYIEGRLFFDNEDRLQFEERDASGGTSDGRRLTTQRFKDVTAWYNIVLTLNSTEGTEIDRAKIYVNGTQITAFDATRSISSSYSFSFFRSSVDNFVGCLSGSSDYFDGCLAEINFIDGQALDSSYFGFTDSQTGMWMPKRYEGTYGNNGFHLEFKDNSSTSTLGKDTSGNQNDFSTTNIAITLGTSDDSFIDTPTNNFPTFNPSNRSSGPTLDWGNLYFFYNYKPASKTCRTTFRLPKSGKYYWEWENNESSSNPGRWQSTIGNVVNIATNSVDVNAANNANFVSYSYGGSTWNGTTHVSASWDGTTRSWYRPQRAAWAVDCDTGNIWVGRVADDATTQWWASDGSATGNPSKLLNPTCAIDKDKTHEYTPMVCWHDGGAAVSTGFAIDVNFGQHAFKGTVPDGFKTLSSANIPPDPSTNIILRPQKHFETIVYTGDTSGNLKVTGLEFKPDLVWIKYRGGTDNHQLFDTMRGFDSGLRLFPNENSGDAQNGSQYGMISVEDGGFTVGAGPFEANRDGGSHAAWCWKAGGNSNTFNVDGIGYATAAAAGLDDGTISLTGASVNTEAGFSIVKYAGTDSGSSQTIPHGLNQPPEFWMWKCRTSSTDWIVYTTAIDGSSDYLLLNGQDAASSGVSPWDTAPTSSVVTVGTNNADTCNAGDNYVLYLWHSVPGFSKFGTYTGNGNAAGPFVFTGFRPAWIMVKLSGYTGNWIIFDNKRDPFNYCDTRLFANLSNADTGSYNVISMLSNGFRFENQYDGSWNRNNTKFVFMAFAEQPDFTNFGTMPNAR